MVISMTAEFSLAVHGLVYLEHTGRVTTSEELAKNICTNPARVRKVMSKLRQAKLVDSLEGKGHGYLAGEQVREITLEQVLDALQEKVVTAGWHSGNVDMDCLITSGMGAVMDRIFGEMNGNCKTYLSQITIGSIHDEIFRTTRS